MILENRINVLILSIILFCSVNYVNGQNLQLKVSNQHPFLVDHSRTLYVYEKEIPVDSISLSPYTGNDIYASLFENDSSFILIDGNGMWFYLDKQTNRFYKGEWNWQKPIPDGYLGTYVFQIKNNAYVLEKRENSLSDIYQIKNPMDYSGRFYNPFPKKRGRRRTIEP